MLAQDSIGIARSANDEAIALSASRRIAALSPARTIPRKRQ
jgi:hypothetical protein